MKFMKVFFIDIFKSDIILGFVYIFGSLLLGLWILFRFDLRFYRRLRVKLRF